MEIQTDIELEMMIMMTDRSIVYRERSTFIKFELNNAAKENVDIQSENK